MSKADSLNQAADRACTGMLSLAIAVSLAACGSGSNEYEIIDSLDAENMQVILEYAPSELAFGAANFRVRAEGGRSEAVLYETKISNDGGDLSRDNVKAKFTNPGFLWLCLNGVEQSDVSVKIELATGLVIEDTRPCGD